MHNEIIVQKKMAYVLFFLFCPSLRSHFRQKKVYLYIVARVRRKKKEVLRVEVHQHSFSEQVR